MVLRRESKEERQRKEILKCPALGCPPSPVPGANLNCCGRHQKVHNHPCLVGDTDHRVDIWHRLTSRLLSNHSLCPVRPIHPSTIFRCVFTQSWGNLNTYVLIPLLSLGRAEVTRLTSGLVSSSRKEIIP